MTRERERLIEIMNDEINASEFRVTSDVLGRSADGILAEMAGEWNAAIEAALVAASARKKFTFRDDTGRPLTADEIQQAIRALRRPDAAQAARPVPQADKVALLVETLRVGTLTGYGDETMAEAADLLTAQAAEIERQRNHIRAQVEDMDTLAAALAAKDAEIDSWRKRALQFADERDNADRVIEDTAAELGCEPDNEAILVAIDELKVRAALAPAGKEVKP